MENVAIKGRGGNDVQHKNWKGKILRIWITIIRHGGLGHEVQESLVSRVPLVHTSLKASQVTPFTLQLKHAPSLHTLLLTLKM